ncbi:MAG: glycosyltransferase family 2 protein [Sedimentitalea sp.]
MIDAVVIGRNEGDRLLACLASLAPQVRRIVYVDSGSSDGSADAARAFGAVVVNLDMTRPFTAARARNAGVAQLTVGDTDYVQFVDGDCSVVDGWIAQARAYLEATPNAAVVCGRRREEHPEHSRYNRFCDDEWNTPIGPALACGGDALMRLDAVVGVGGYREDLIAGEEPELCVRLRQSGWAIFRLDGEMTLHDAKILRFAQWWKRTKRAGHAFAEGADLHGAPPERHWVGETRRALIWGAGLPLGLGLLAVLVPFGWLALAIYPLQVLRLARRDGTGLVTALFSVLGKFAEAQGALQYYFSKVQGRKTRLMEYK